MHENGYVHGNLHVENVAIHTSRRGRLVVNLIDFGMCKPVGSRFGARPGARMTQHPPELMQDGWAEVKAAPSHDFWSAGVLLWTAVQLSSVFVTDHPVLKAEQLEAEMVSCDGFDAAREVLEQKLCYHCPWEEIRGYMRQMLEPEPDRRVGASELLTEMRRARTMAAAAKAACAAGAGAAEVWRMVRDAETAVRRAKAAKSVDCAERARKRRRD